MGKATGVFLILAGVGTAALVLPSVDKEAERQLADVIKIATGAAPQLPSQPSASVAASAPAPATMAATAPQARPTLATSPAASPNGAQPVLVAPPQIITRNTIAAPARPAGSEARANLARDIQSELKRVGCYDGEVSGEWSPATRRAMKTFIDRVNAALPTDEPDHILRTMVQGHPGNACGKACPSGQTAATDGRCLPSAIVAQATRRPLSRQDAATPPLANAPRVPAPVEIAALPAATTSVVVTGSTKSAAAVVAEVRPQRTPVPKPSWETTVAAAPVQPLPGNEPRMAIGGPVPPTADAPHGVAIGPRIPQVAGSPAIVALPGAIAALSAAGGDAVVHTPARRPSPAQRPVSEADSRDVPAAAKPERPRRAVAEAPARRPQPQREFKFPAPMFAGIRMPRYVTGPQVSSERSAFNVRIYERLIRESR